MARRVLEYNFMTDSSDGTWCVHIDTGGTFTDCIAESPDGRTFRNKTLSRGSLPASVARVCTRNILLLDAAWVSPDDFSVGFSVIFPNHPENLGKVVAYEANARRLTLYEPLSFVPEVGEPLELDSGMEAPVLATNLVLANEGIDASSVPLSLRLATTRCTNALLEGKGVSPMFFVTRGFRDLLRIGDQRRLGLFDLCPGTRETLHGEVIEVSERMDRNGQVIEPIDLKDLREKLRALPAETCKVAAVSLLHSYANPSHEKILSEFLRSEGFLVVAESAALYPFVKWLPRAESSVVEAYLTPVLRQYLDDVAAFIHRGTLRVMMSTGGLVGKNDYRAVDSLLSGPAGGVVGAAAVAERAGFSKIIALDMGGTSADVSRYDGDFDYRDRHEVGSASISASALKIETVAAGGGSICRLAGGLLWVGPKSAGARPGPACYGYGGPLCLTDVNLLLGRLSPEHFAGPVFPKESERRLEQMLQGTSRTREETLMGFLDVANDTMAGAIRNVSVREGYDPSDYALVAFGGAGGQHACGVAEKLGVTRVLSPVDAGLLSAYGLSKAPLERFAEKQVLRPLLETDLSALEEELAREVLDALSLESEGGAVRRKTAFLRFSRQDASLEIDYSDIADLHSLFEARYRDVFGYVPTGGLVEIVSLRLIASVEVEADPSENFSSSIPDVYRGMDASSGPPLRVRETLMSYDVFDGPALIPDSFGTLFLESGWRGRVGDRGSLLLEKISIVKVPEFGASGFRGIAARELFSNRFLTLVEEMGARLERSALSTNVKDRLDFSCALLDSDGLLTANAPHVPVHLGALGLCVREIAATLSLEPGDVVVSNHPGFGGSHLPDLTVIAPVHDKSGNLFAYVANRAHHAEIGGVRPGSMPPEALNLAEEGVVIPPTYLFEKGESRVEEVARLFCEGPWPSRRPEENHADLLAQVASVRFGCNRLSELAEEHGSRTLGEQMKHLRDRSAGICREFLARHDGADLQTEQRLDDGSLIAVAITIRDSRAIFDFTGTDPRHSANLNATAAIVRSSLVYALRVLSEREVPLNEGFLEPIEIILPEDSFLSPAFPDDPFESPAVAGGNVEVSQRLVDALLLAFGKVACSQGTMNNVVFGDATRSHYETVAGGAGATIGADGASGVHVHMTNTAITDPEILELRQPVRLERFCLRQGSGGSGSWSGGDGVEREYLFEEALSVSVITQRRTEGPEGIAGGQAGQPGKQLLIRADGSREKLGSVDQFEAKPGDRLLLLTPGGGGAGQPELLA